MQPVLPYQELIADYDPNKEGIEIAERGFNNFFTEQEIKSLENYLATKEIGLEIKKAEDFPVSSDYVGLGDSPLGGGGLNYPNRRDVRYPLMSGGITIIKTLRIWFTAQRSEVEWCLSIC